MQESKNFNSIDLFKLLMAIAVVAIHTNPIERWTNPTAIAIVVMLEEWAVPFFFVASGFFLFNGMKKPYIDGINRIDKYMIKIFIMYCAWTIISFPLTLYGYAVSGNSVMSCILSYIKYFLFVGKLYNSYHLWYLLALLYALAGIRFMIKKGFSPYAISTVSAVIYLFAEIMKIFMEHADTLDGVLHKFVSLYQFVFNNGGIFTGMVYVSAGMLIACYRFNINKWFGAALLVSVNIAKLFCDISILMPVEACLLFMLLLMVKLPEHEFWEKCRKVSTVIYLSHLIFYSIYTFIVLKNPNKLGLDSFAVTLFLSLLNALVLIRAQKREHFKLLKYII